jgi:hypothetical protein
MLWIGGGLVDPYAGTRAKVVHRLVCWVLDPVDFLRSYQIYH